ncbi:MAG: hypothetical protein HY305_07055 [Sphingobacteriales bacterium]|nr:hypothetical protein [Sphingobacteriales bacterium]
MEIINLQLTVGEAIEEFYHKNNFGKDGGIHEKYAWIKFGFFSIPIPNAESRRNNVHLHDIHHLITGNNTTWKGESAVSAWEIAAGGWGKLYLPWLLTLWAMGLGVTFYPANVLKSFRQGLTMNNALTCGLSKNELYSLSISDARKILSHESKQNKNPYWWMLISFLIFAVPFLIGFIAVWKTILLF